MFFKNFILILFKQHSYQILSNRCLRLSRSAFLFETFIRLLFGSSLHTKYTYLSYIICLILDRSQSGTSQNFSWSSYSSYSYYSEFR